MRGVEPAGLLEVQRAVGATLQVHRVGVVGASDLEARVEADVAVGLAVAVAVLEAPDAVPSEDEDLPVHDLEPERLVEAGREATPGQDSVLRVDVAHRPHVAVGRADDAVAVRQEADAARVDQRTPGVLVRERQRIDDVGPRPLAAHELRLDRCVARGGRLVVHADEDDLGFHAALLAIGERPHAKPALHDAVDEVHLLVDRLAVHLVHEQDVAALESQLAEAHLTLEPHRGSEHRPRPRARLVQQAEAHIAELEERPAPPRDELHRLEVVQHVEPAL